MQIDVDQNLIELVKKLEINPSTAVSEGLIMWLKNNLLQCPITEDFCENIKGSCNGCLEATKKKILH